MTAGQADKLVLTLNKSDLLADHEDACIITAHLEDVMAIWSSHQKRKSPLNSKVLVDSLVLVMEIILALNQIKNQNEAYLQANVLPLLAQHMKLV